MKKTLLSFALLLLAFGANAQLRCEEKFTMRNIAPSGLNMRAEPKIGSPVVTTVPYDSLLLACQNTSGQLTVENIKGYWRHVDYKGKTGYMFDGFLEIISTQPVAEVATSTGQVSPPAEPIEAEPELPELEYQLLTEAYNYCGDIQKIDPGLLWYAIFPADRENKETMHHMEMVELNIVLSKAKLGKGLEFDIETDRQERSVFLLGVNRQLNLENLELSDESERLRYSGRKVFPGQQLELQKKTASLSATGTVQSSGDCPVLKNYKLELNGKKNGKTLTQNLSPSLPAGECGMPEVYWFGDFTGDGFPEVIFVSVYEEKNTFTLFISENTESGKLLRPEAEWTIGKCY